MRNSIIAIALCLGIFSCEKPIDISSVTLQNRLVVNALLNNQDKIAISVSHSTNVFDSVKPSPINNATVFVKDQAGVKTFCLYNGVSQKYECNIIPKLNEKYTVNVSALGYKDASAELQIPNTATSGSSKWKDSTSVDSLGFPNGTITVSLNDNGGQKNYYRISLFYFNTGLAEWIVLKPIVDDAQLENQALFTEDGGMIFTDVLFNGKNKNVGFKTPFGFGFQSPKFLAIIENLSFEYYQYFKSLDAYKNNSGLFAEPTQVYSNINNGLGIFASSSLQRDTIK